MPQKQLTDRVVHELLRNALLSSVDPNKLSTSIHSLLGIMLTAKELSRITTYHQLLERVKAELENTTTL